MSLVYKTLFTINILHEYFLTTPEGKTVFDETTPEARMAFLLNEFSLEIRPSAVTWILHFPLPWSPTMIIMD